MFADVFRDSIMQETRALACRMSVRFHVSLDVVTVHENAAWKGAPELPS